MADRFPIILNTSANQLQEIASGDTLDVSGAAVKTNLVDSLSVVGTGVSIVGVVTATSFVGSGANLTNIDITAVKDSGGNVKIQAQDSGAIYTGIHTFGSTTSFTNGVFNGTVTSTGAVVNGDSDLNGDLDVDGHTNLDNVSVAGVSTFANDVTFTGTNYTGAIWDKSEDHLKLNDNTRLRLGSGANDGNLRHDGTYTWFQNNNGPLLIDSGTNYLALISGNNLAGGKMAKFTHNGSAELYWDNSKKLETTTTGITVTGNVVSTGADINGDIDVDGHTNLDNVNVAGVTTFAGAINGSSAAFTGDVSVAGTLTYEDVKNVDSVGVATARTGLKVLAGGANIVGVVTASNGIFVPDSQTIHVGGSSGSGDLQIYHDTSNSYVKDNGTGDLLLQTQGGYVKIRYGSDTMALFQPSNKAELYFANSAKLATTNTGVTITGNATATTFIGALTGTASGNTTITNNADNRVVTGGSGNALNGESDLTFDGNTLTHTVGADTHRIQSIASGNHYTTLEFNSNRSAANDVLSIINFKWDGDTVADILAVAGSDSSNKDDGQLKFRTSPSQGSIAERVRIEQNGQIGVGGISPRTINSHASQVQISGNNYSDATVSIINNANDSNGAYLFLAKQRSGSAGGSTIIQSNDIIGQIRFSGADGTDLENPMAYIECRADGTPGSNDVPGRLQFYTTPDGSGAPQVRMTIKNNGRVGINESDPSEVLYVAGNIYATGNVTAYSDIRVKENVKEISNALEAVDKIRGVSYTRKDTKEDTLGVSAQEVESMFPELVVEDNHGMKSVNYNGLVGVLFSAVKELSTKLKEIEDK